VTDAAAFEVVGTSHVGTFGFLGLERRTLTTPTGDTTERIVVTHPGAVAVVAIIEDEIVLIDQYRAAAGRVTTEIPAGKLDPSDTDKRVAAVRELREETGYEARTWKELTTMWSAVGFCDEQITIFLATDLSDGPRAPEGAEEQASTVRRMPFDEAVALVVSGELTDAKTIAGIMVADAHRRAT